MTTEVTICNTGHYPIEVAVTGVPGTRPLQPSQLVKLTIWEGRELTVREVQPPKKEPITP